MQRKPNCRCCWRKWDQSYWPNVLQSLLPSTSWFMNLTYLKNKNIPRRRSIKSRSHSVLTPKSWPRGCALAVIINWERPKRQTNVSTSISRFIAKGYVRLVICTATMRPREKQKTTKKWKRKNKSKPRKNLWVNPVKMRLTENHIIKNILPAIIAISRQIDFKKRLILVQFKKIIYWNLWEY